MSARCDGCDSEILYRTPERTLSLASTLLGIVADEHRADHPDAKLGEATDTAAVAVTCPSCGAALPIDAHSTFSTCAYCKTTSRIPSKVRRGSAAAKVEPIWGLFSGASNARTKMERRLEEDRSRAERAKKKEHEARDQHSQNDAVERASIGVAKRNSVIFALAALGSIGALALTRAKLGENRGPRWFGASFYVVVSVLVLGTAVGLAVFGVPTGKGEKQWNPSPEKEQRITLAVAFAVLLASVAISIVVTR
jgi:hypothetical protein